MYQRALERVDMAMDIYRTLLFEEKLCKCRMAAGYIQSLLTQAAAFMNQTFADCGIFRKTGGAGQRGKQNVSLSRTEGGS